MFRWLEGPGAAFKQPLPRSTNYLSAYDKEGQLLRLREGSMDDSNSNADKSSSSAEDAELDDTGGDSQESEGLNEADGDAKTKLPPARLRDLKPFPLNPDFMSQRVLDESSREEIYRRVAVQGKSVKVVSAELGVEMSRVGAVVRLKTLEKDWENKGKPIARPYQKAVLAMLPRTYHKTSPPPVHEPINDLPAHPATLQQIFHPTSESRAFTRVDAAAVFDRSLLPTDARVPHPELIALERQRAQGVDKAEVTRQQRERTKKDREERAAREEKRRGRLEKTVKTVAPAGEGGVGGRWEWRFTDFSVQDVGRDGRAPAGTGWRYGVPHQDRKRGQVKIPTRVQ
ncbi:MAG: hypothetical protein M1833_001647 [Piccolia ochrophora]|nr:MAG: hypothetical protein M1833_001647 [Piccolia ochrophora]